MGGTSARAAGREARPLSGRSSLTRRFSENETGAVTATAEPGGTAREDDRNRVRGLGRVGGLRRAEEVPRRRCPSPPRSRAPVAATRS